MHPPYCTTRLCVGFINPGSLGDRLPRQSSTRESKNNRAKGRSSNRPEGLAQEEQRPLVSYFGPPIRPKRSVRAPAASPIGRPAPSPTSDSDPASLRPGYVRTLLAALLRPAQPKPTRVIRPGTPARKGPGTNGESSTRVKPWYRDHTLYTYRNSVPQPP